MHATIGREAALATTVAACPNMASSTVALRSIREDAELRRLHRLGIGVQGRQCRLRRFGKRTTMLQRC